MRKKPESSRQVVYLPPRTVQEIIDIANKKTGKSYGAIQGALERGAELALAELRGDLPVKAADNSLTAEVNVEKQTIEGYNSLHAVEAARRVAKSLIEIAADLETAMEKDAAAKIVKTDRLGKALHDAKPELEQAEELVRSAARSPRNSQKSEGNARKVK